MLKIIPLPRQNKAFNNSRIREQFNNCNCSCNHSEIVVLCKNKVISVIADGIVTLLCKRNWEGKVLKYMELASFIIAVISAVVSIVTYIATVRYEKRRTTIEAINLLQNEVLDKFINISKDNAEIIIDNLDDPKCKEAYNDYRALIARLEHFAIGVNKHIYDFSIVNNLLGVHFICLYLKIAPIIDKANKNQEKTRHYCNFLRLINKLDKKQKILNQGGCKK